MRLLLVGLILLGGLTGAAVSRYLGLLLYMWFAIFRPQEWVWTDVSDLRASMIVGIVFVVPTMLGGTWPNVSHRVSRAILLFIAVALVAEATAFDRALGWAALSQFLRVALVCLLAIPVINTRQRLLYAVVVAAVSLGFHTAKSGLAVLLSSGGQLYEGIGGAFADNNGFAAAAVMILPLIIASGQNMTRRWVRLGFYASAALSVVTIIGTFSRGGVIGLAVATMAFVLLQRRRSWAVIGLAAAIAAGAVAVPISDAYIDRVRTISSTPEDNSALGRLHFWSVAIDIARDRPFGVGMGNYEAAYDQYDKTEGLYGKGRAVHSSHFQVIAETGFGGFAAYVLFLGLSMLTAWRVRRASFDPRRSPEDQHYLFTLANGLLTSFIGFIAAGAFVSLALNDLTWISAALIAVLDRLAAQPAEATVTAGTPAQAARIEPRRIPRIAPRRPAPVPTPVSATPSGLDLFLPANAYAQRPDGSR
jgi:probable O-glycosylation ligase (exosortase A-associated)